MMKKFILVVCLVLTILLLLWWNPLAKKQAVDTDGWHQLIPSEKIPEQVHGMKGNNNLDAIAYQGKYYVAFRTAPSHFASKKAKLYIISSTDLEQWDFEHEIHVGADVREPRFVANKDTLYFYFFEGGKKFYKFEPQKIWVTYKTMQTNWQAEQDVGLDGFVPWRLRSRNDTIYLSAYYGKDLYNSAHQGNQRLYYSSNGFSFQAISEKPQVAEMGVEEGEFIFDSIGNIWGTLRMEGDGAMTFFADKSDLSNWKTNYTKNKYDSALLFEHKGEHYLIARRNMDGASKKGNFRLYNLVRYSFTKKRTALFHFNKTTMEMDWLKDFPSTGDTAFPAIIPLEDNRYFLLNYSSNINGKEKNWIKGQLGRTYIYSTILNMEALLKTVN
jgi:hypothetical protein